MRNDDVAALMERLTAVAVAVDGCSWEVVVRVGGIGFGVVSWREVEVEWSTNVGRVIPLTLPDCEAARSNATQCVS